MSSKSPVMLNSDINNGINKSKEYKKGVNVEAVATAAKRGNCGNSAQRLDSAHKLLTKYFFFEKGCLQGKV